MSDSIDCPYILNGGDMLIRNWFTKYADLKRLHTIGVTNNNTHTHVKY